MPLVPVEALIPYIYVLPNNSFIDFIKERDREKEKKGEGEREREREGERETKSFTVYLHPRSFPRPSFLAPFYFFALRSRYGCLLGLNGQERFTVCRSSGEVWIKGVRCKLGICQRERFLPPFFSYARSEWYSPPRGEGL